LFNLGLFLSYAFVVSFTPGPNNIMSLYNASQKGFKKNLEFCYGVACGFFVLMALCSIFNYWLHNSLPMIEPYMKIVGATYMFYLAYKIFKSPPPEESGRTQEILTYRTGFFMQFVNPKAILYGITIVSTFIMPHYTAWYVLLGFSLFLAFIAILSTSLWAAFGSLFTKFLKVHYKEFNLLMSGMLVYTAVSILGILH